MNIKDIKVGDIISANGQQFLVTSEPYIPNNLEEDSAVDEYYCNGEYIIPVDDGGAIYESEVVEILPQKSNFKRENNMIDVYKEFDSKCQQKGLFEIFKTQSQSTYFLMRRMFEEKKIKFLGIGNDWKGEYEIRFSIH